MEKNSFIERFISWRTAVSFLIPICVIAFFIFKFNIDLRSTLDNMLEANLTVYLLALFLYYTTFPIRAIRWKIIINNAVDKFSKIYIPNILLLSEIIMIGWLGNSIAPLRLGDAYRVYLFSRDSKADISFSSATVIAERITDLFVVLPVLLGFGLLFILEQGDYDISNSIIILLPLIFLSVLLAAIFLIFRLRRILSTIIPRKVANASVKIKDISLSSLRRTRILMLLSVGAWATESIRLWLVSESVGVELGMPMIIFASVFNAILSSVPIVPGGLGILEPGLVGVLMLRTSRASAVSLVLLDRSISYLSVIFFGALALAFRYITGRH